MSAPKYSEGRLASVLLAPIVSEKATQVAEKHNQVLFKVLRDATKPEIKAMGLTSVLVIADQVDDNLLLASRNLANVLVVEPRYADPLSLVFYKKVLVTKGAIEQLKEMFA